MAGPSLPLPRYGLAAGTAHDPAALIDADLETGVSVSLAADRSGVVTIQYDQLQTVRSMRVFFPRLRNTFRGMPVSGTSYRALYLGKHARWMTLPT